MGDNQGRRQRGRAAVGADLRGQRSAADAGQTVGQQLEARRTSLLGGGEWVTGQTRQAEETARTGAQWETRTRGEVLHRLCEHFWLFPLRLIF